MAYFGEKVDQLEVQLFLTNDKDNILFNHNVHIEMTYIFLL